MNYVWVVLYSSDCGCVEEFEVIAVCKSKKSAKEYIKNNIDEYESMSNYTYEKWKVR